MKKVVQKKPVTFLEGEMKIVLSYFWREINQTGHCGWVKQETASLDYAVRVIHANPPGVVIADLDHLTEAGLNYLLLEGLRFKVTIIFLSSVPERKVAQQGTDAGVSGYLLKREFSIRALETVIQKAYYARRVTR